jgi:N-hydroxyarylamine O-acetyltransferase
MSDIDLPAYLDRIGWTGPVRPDLPTLAGLIACHAESVPFENLDVVLGRPIRLDMPSLLRKLITDRRGGYCFEQNGVLQAALTAIGFDVTPLLARVVRGLPADSGTPRTHMVLRVALPEGAFLADVGFGGLTPTAPLRFGTDDAQATRHETFRLVAMGAELLLQADMGGDWMNVYRLSLDTAYPIDFEMGNWFTSTRPNGVFTSNLVLARPLPGRRVTLLNGRLTVRTTDGAAERREIRGVAAYQEVLAELFGLALPADDLAAVAAAGDRYAAEGRTHPSF